MNDFTYWRGRLYAGLVFQNIADVNECYLIDLQSKDYMTIDIAAVRSYLPARGEFSDYMETNGLKGSIQYLPRSKFRILNAAGVAPILNTYTPPAWLKDNFYSGVPLPVITTPPKLFDDYLEHLVDGHQPSKEYVYDWLATSLQGRNYTYLTAVGGQGIGKTVFSDIMGQVHGLTNFTGDGCGIFKRQFNSSLADKTLVFIDEVSLNKKDEIDRVKEVANNSIRVEAKGVDSRSITNHASFYFASNHLDAIKLPADDRRFSIIQLTEARLSDKLPASQIEKLKSLEIAAELGPYLMQRTITHNMMMPFRNSTTYLDIADSSLASWEHNLIKVSLPEREPGTFLSVRELQRLVQLETPYYNVPPGRIKLQEFAKRFPGQLRFCKQEGIQGIEILTKIESNEGFATAPKSIGLVK